MGKRWMEKSGWRKGQVNPTSWGHQQEVIDSLGVTVASVDVPEGNASNLDLILAAKRLHRACKLMASVLEENPWLSDKLCQEMEGFQDAILEIRKGARLYPNKQKKGPV